ncbi:LysR family transcriptional regulator [Amycolatopsis jejuensis]|uniref:LysR family transcriptional regulator n=1 Tax=Amycolatopsis jejuensis TaxID=330084 RepID=UPI0005253E4E|nr:LysR family transcriptional regulator [Amycolatopsis jejuensis]
MELHQLEYFLAVVDHGGFNRAAEALHLAQPSLSQAIRRLESSVGTPLFERSKRGTVLNDAGRSLVDPARQVLRSVATARQAVSADAADLAGTVELAGSPAATLTPLPQVIRELQRHHPRVVVRIQQSVTTAEVIKKVRTGLCEVGLVAGPDGGEIPGVRRIRLGRTEVILAIPPQVDPPAAGRVRMETLDGARFIVGPAGSQVRELYETLVQSGIGLVKVVEAAHRESVLPMVHAGVGYAFLPQAWAPIAAGVGVQVRRLDPPQPYGMWAMARTGPMTPAAQAFLTAAERLALRADDDG